MENNNKRRLLLAVGIVLLFAIIVIAWYFSSETNPTAKSLNETNNPIPTKTFPARFNFLNWGEAPKTTTTETFDPLKDPLIQIWNKPAAGQVFVTDQILKEITATTTEGTSTKIITIKKTERATTTLVKFVDRTTGYIYGYPLETGKVFQISNTVVPGIHDAYFFENGKRVVMRYLDKDKNIVIGFIANVPNVEPTGVPTPLEKIQYLTREVVSVAVNNKKTAASYIIATGEGSATYTLGAKEPIFVSTSPFREWSLAYGGNDLYATTKPSAYVEGGTFSLPQHESEISEKTGLMTTPGSSGVLLNSMWGDKGLVTFISDNGKIKIAPITTLATKCSWGKKTFLVCAIPRDFPLAEEGLPDDWFQGRVSFSDDLVLLDSNSLEKYSLYSFSEKEGSFDITNLSLSDDDKIFTFTNKKDSTLWLLNSNLIRHD